MRWRCTKAFEQAGALDKLEGFASHYGPDFYGLPRNRSTLTLKRQEYVVPRRGCPMAQPLVPLAAGESLAWRAKARQSARFPAQDRRPGALPAVPSNG